MSEKEQIIIAAYNEKILQEFKEQAEDGLFKIRQAESQKLSKACKERCIYHKLYSDVNEDYLMDNYCLNCPFGSTIDKIDEMLEELFPWEPCGLTVKE